MVTETINGKNIGLILLAGGGSSRLGRPKQLLLYNGRTLLRRSLEVATASKAQPIVAVLGAQVETMKRETEGFAVEVVINADWHEGMASSIREGIKVLIGINSYVQGAILMVCDQPYVTPSLLNELITTYETTGKPVVTCGYENTFGPPAFFHNSLFEELLQLEGDVGARGVVRQHTDSVEVIPFPEGTYDVDTEEDYEKVTTNKH